MTSAALKFSQRVQGPVFPILALFNENGKLDMQGIADYVEFLISQGVKNVMCTVGTSRYDVLTIEEMMQVNQIVVEAAAKRAVTIVTTPSYGPTSSSIQFAQHAEKIGADAIIGVYPDRYYGDETIVDFFKAITASTDIGVMIHEMPIRAGRSTEAPSAHYSPALLEKIFSLEGMVGLKEESGDVQLIEYINTTYSNKVAVIGGRGGMNAYKSATQFGQQSYLVGIGNFLPKLELDFVKHIKHGELKAAENIINNIEKPFFDVTVKFGWHIALKAAMSIKGLCQPYERSPMRGLTAAENDALLSLMQKLQLV